MISKDEIKVTGYSVGAIIISLALQISPFGDSLKKSWYFTLFIGMLIVFITSKLADKLGG